MCACDACGCSGGASKPLFKGDENITADAIVLFDGKDLSQWRSRKTGGAAGWKVENGYMEVVPGMGDIYSDKVFYDHQLHVEFWLPLMADCQGQERANSGVFVQGRYEIQVLDSYGLEGLDDDCGAVYRRARPLVNACRPPEQWQTYDVFFLAPRYNEHDHETDCAHISVLHNGIWIHHDLELYHHCGGEIDKNHEQPGPLMLQEHNDRVRYRNIWVRKL